MSIHLLATGSLVSDPQRRTGKTGADYATANLRCHTENGEYAFISAIAFGDAAAELLRHHQGSTLAISWRAKLQTWVGKDGETKAGLSIVAEQIASAASARRADAERRRGARDAA